MRTPRTVRKKKIRPLPEWRGPVVSLLGKVLLFDSNGIKTV